MTRHSLEKLRPRYVIEGRPLEAGLEEMLRAKQKLTKTIRKLKATWVEPKFCRHRVP